jgi:hypothetical protein
MAYKNEKYEHIQNFWKLESKTESSLFWQLEASGYDKCDINVLHAIRKFGSIFMWRKCPKGESQFEWSMTGLPSTIEKHTPVTADQVWTSIEKLLAAKIITGVNKKTEEKYGGKQRKITLIFDVEIPQIKDMISSQSTVKLF